MLSCWYLGHSKYWVAFKFAAFRLGFGVLGLVTINASIRARASIYGGNRIDGPVR